MQRTTTSHSHLQRATMNHNETQRAPMSRNKPQRATTTHNEPQRTTTPTTSHNETQRTTTSQNEPQLATTNHNHPQRATISHNDWQQPPRNLSSVTLWTRYIYDEIIRTCFYGLLFLIFNAPLFSFVKFSTLHLSQLLSTVWFNQNKDKFSCF